MQHEVLAVFALERVDDLLILPGPERGDAECLRLASGEQGGAVRTRQHANFGDDGPDRLGIAAVDAAAGVQDGTADHVGFQIMEQRLGLLGVETFAGQCLGHLAAHGIDLGVAGSLVRLLVSLSEAGAGHGVHPGLQRQLLGGRLGERPRLLRGMFRQFDDRLDHRLEALVAEGDGAKHDVLGQLLRLGLHHQHAFSGAGDHQFELAALHLVGGGVEDVLPVFVADAGGGDRSEERDAGQRQCGRAADQGDDVGVVLQIVAEHSGDDLHLVAEILREQRTDRAVDQARLQGLGLAGPAFALEEAAGDLTGGERLFLVVHGEREEVLARTGGLHPDGRAQHDGVAIAC